MAEMGGYLWGLQGLCGHVWHDDIVRLEHCSSTPLSSLLSSTHSRGLDVGILTSSLSYFSKFI